MEYGLIGEKLEHSFSKEIHDMFGKYPYEIHPLLPDQVASFLEEKAFNGINVTIPYKTVAMEYCHEIEEKAKEIGAINTIVNKEGKLYGYNTDYYGFAYLLDTYKIALRNKAVLILGNGGTTKTVKTVVKDRGAASIKIASRTPSEATISYEEAQNDASIQIIINASPVGMFPNNGECLIDVNQYPKLEAVVDVVYNPLKTKLLLDAKKKGIIAVNGLEMLVAQAKKSAELFTEQRIAIEDLEVVYKKLIARFSNISLIGLPGSGKSSLGKIMAEKLGKPFVDIDDEVVKKAGKSIPAIFEEDGEPAFRALEAEITREICQNNGQVIATGGGIVLDPKNISALKQNGTIIWIEADPEKLAISDDRPLAKNIEDLIALADKRNPLYKGAADHIITYHTSFQENIDRLRNAYQKLYK